MRVEGEEFVATDISYDEVQVCKEVKGNDFHGIMPSQLLRLFHLTLICEMHYIFETQRFCKFIIIIIFNMILVALGF